MTAPAHRVLTLVAGMSALDRAVLSPSDIDTASGGAAPEAETVGVNDPDRAARVAAIAAEYGGEVG